MEPLLVEIPASYIIEAGACRLIAVGSSQRVEVFKINHQNQRRQRTEEYCFLPSDTHLLARLPYAPSLRLYLQEGLHYIIVEGLVAQRILVREIAVNYARPLFIDIDGTIPNILKGRTGWRAVLSSSPLPSITKQVLGLGIQNDVVVFNSLNTLAAESRLLSQNKDWTYKLFRSLIAVSALCSMLSKRTIYLHLYTRLPSIQKLSRGSIFRIMQTMSDVWLVRAYGRSIKFESIRGYT